MEYAKELERFDLFQRGYDAFGQSPLRFEGAGANAKAMTLMESGIPSNFIQDGDTIVRLNVIDGHLQSDGFVSGSNGWQINSDGEAEFESGYFRGDISAATGTFSETLYVNDGTNDRVLIGFQSGGF